MSTLCWAQPRGFWGGPHPLEVQELLLAQILWDLGLALSVKVNRDFLFVSFSLLVNGT